MVALVYIACFILHLAVFIRTGNATAAYTSVKSDYEKLIDAYQTTDSVGLQPIIPQTSMASPITVALGMDIYSIMDFDAVNGKITLIGAMTVQWQDEIKDLSGTTFSGSLETLLVDYDKVWNPNLVLMNDAQSVEKIGDLAYRVRYNTSSGACHWKPRLIINAACIPDMTFFPFDEQRCSLTVTPWFQDQTRITLSTLSNTWDTSDMSDSGIWGVSSTKSLTYIKHGDPYVDFTIVIKRKPMFLTIVIVLPVLLLSLLTGFLFLLPPGTGERTGFGVTCFLSFVVILQLLMQFMPESSVPMSVLCYYVIIMLMFAASLSIVNMLILRMYLSPSSDQIPSWLILLVKIARLIPCRFVYRRARRKLRSCRRRYCSRDKHDFVKNTKFDFSKMHGAWLQNKPEATHGHVSRISASPSQVFPFPNVHEVIDTTEKTTIDSDRPSTNSLPEREIRVFSTSASLVIADDFTENKTPSVKSTPKPFLRNRKLGFQRNENAVVGSMERTIESLTAPREIDESVLCHQNMIQAEETDSDHTGNKYLETSEFPSSIGDRQSRKIDYDKSESRNENVENAHEAFRELRANTNTPTTSSLLERDVSGHSNLVPLDYLDNYDEHERPSTAPTCTRLVDSESYFHRDEKPLRNRNKTMEDTTVHNEGDTSEVDIPSLRYEKPMIKHSKGMNFKTAQTERKEKIPNDKTPHVIKPRLAIESDQVVTDDEEEIDEVENTPAFIASLTWERIAKILDVFFIVVFVSVQTVFTVFFLVPLLARG